MICHATWIDELKSEWLVGFFSSPEKAQAGCQDWHDQIWRNTRRLLWVGNGETLTAQSDQTRFEVNPITLDVVETPFS